MSPCLGAHWRSSRLAALLSVMVHCSLIHKSVTNSGWLWSSEDQTLSFTVRVRSALISPAQGGSSGRNWTAQKILVHYFLVELQDISVQLVARVGRRGPCSCSFSGCHQGSSRINSCFLGIARFAGFPVITPGRGRGKVGQLSCVCSEQQDTVCDINTEQ